MNCSLCPFKFVYYLNYKVAYSTTYVVQYFYFANISAETKLLAKSFKPVDQGASVQLIDQGKKILWHCVFKWYGHKNEKTCLMFSRLPPPACPGCAGWFVGWGQPWSPHSSAPCTDMSGTTWFITINKKQSSQHLGLLYTVYFSQSDVAVRVRY